MQKFSRSFLIIGLSASAAWCQAPVPSTQATPVPSATITPVQMIPAPLQVQSVEKNLTGSARPKAPRRTNVGDYIVRVGDQLEVDIFSMPELAKAYQVRADGHFFHPVAGDIDAAGQSLSKIEAVLKQRLTRQLRYPQFQIGLTQIAEAQVSVLGEVKTQGKFSIKPGSSLLDLVALAGGLTARADNEGCTILRDGQQIPVHLSTANSGEAAKFFLRPGDILYVNPGIRISVSGEVNEKGTFAISRHSVNPIEEAIKAAGGAKETAALNRIVLTRPSFPAPVVVNLLTKDATKPLPEVQDGDTIMLPARHAVVLGAADRVGQVPLTGSETLLDIVSITGGGAKGQLDDVVVIRASDVLTGTEKKEDYNLEEALKNGKMTTPVLINDGDVVYIPPKPEGGGGFLQNSMPLINLLYMARLLI